jgi:hypothetical protein
MSGVVKCLDCGRKINNLKKAVKVSGGYVGPTCFKLRGPYSKPLKQMLRSNYDTVELLAKTIELQDNNVDLMGIDRDQLLEEMHGFSETPYFTQFGRYFGTLPHPDGYDYIDESQVKLMDLEDAYLIKKNVGKVRTKADAVEFQRAKYCFVKMFKDPALEKTIFERYESLIGVRLYGVANNAYVMRDSEQRLKNYSEFIISADNSPYPDRFLLIQIGYGSSFRFFPMMLKDGKLIRGLPSVDDTASMARSFARVDDPAIFAYVGAWFMRKNPLEVKEFRTRMGLWKQDHFKNEKSERVFFQWNWDKDEKSNHGTLDKLIKWEKAVNDYEKRGK